eukprot:1150353-Pelagomonas_calceolata.AAC.4
MLPVTVQLPYKSPNDWPSLVRRKLYHCAVLALLLACGAACAFKRKEKKSLRRPKAACIKGSSPNWKARGLTRRPPKPRLDTASLERARNRSNGDLEGCSPCSWTPGLSFSRPLSPRAQQNPPRSPRENKERV